MGLAKPLSAGSSRTRTIEKSVVAVALLLLSFVAIILHSKTYYDGYLNNHDAAQILSKVRLSLSTKGGGETKVKRTEEENDDVNVSVRKDHPLCFSEHLFARVTERKTLNIYEIGKFTKIGRNVSSSIRYDYMCPFMKTRYNCATNKDEAAFKYGEHATHWKLSLIPREHQEACNLWELVASLGGPTGVANTLLSQHEQYPTSKIINVFIGGNSYLRQIFEALVCGFRDDVTDHFVQRGAKYGVSLAELKKRGHRGVNITEIGSFQHPPNNSSGFCDYSTEEHFYEDGLQLPVKCHYKNLESFDDNLGMVEFGGALRFYYMFRPFTYGNVSEVFESKFHLNLEEIDILLFNDHTENVFQKKYPEMVDVFEKKGIWQSKIIWPYKILRKMQERDTSKWFGANNPAIHHPPDDHACMPGVPDDEANLLLFLMLSGSVIV